MARYGAPLRGRAGGGTSPETNSPAPSPDSPAKVGGEGGVLTAPPHTQAQTALWRTIDSRCICSPYVPRTACQSFIHCSVSRAPCGGGRGREEPLSAIAMVLQAAPGDDDLPPPGPPRHTSAAQCLTARTREASPCAGYPAHGSACQSRTPCRARELRRKLFGKFFGCKMVW